MSTCFVEISKFMLATVPTIRGGGGAYAAGVFDPLPQPAFRPRVPKRVKGELSILIS